jgi:hypothetical protein
VDEWLLAAIAAFRQANEQWLVSLSYLNIIEK